MSLRIILRPDQILNWITARDGKPARRRDNETDLRVMFGGASADFEPLSMDEFLDAMKFNHLVMLVDQEDGKTFHKIYAHS